MSPTEYGSDREPPRGGMTRRAALGRFALVTAGAAAGPAVLGGRASAASSKQPTKFKDFKPFNPRVKPGPPTGLPKRVATNFPAGSQYFIDMARNVKQAVQDRGMEFVPTTYGSDTAANIDQLAQLLEKGIGALILQPQDAHGEEATLLKAIKQGVAVAYEVSGPSTIQIAADQYNIGYTQGVVAAKWIKANLGGKAQVVVFNAAKISQSLIPRANGRIAGVKTAGPGVKVVDNQGIVQLTPEEGNNLAQTVLQRHPDVNVWLGDDDTIIGVMSALEAIGKKPTDKIYLSGVNGQANALAAVKKGTLFRTDMAFPNGVYEYAVGQLCCDWIEGKSVPQVMDVNLFPITKANIDSFLTDDRNPRAAYKRGIKKYITYLGNIDYRTRMNYVPSAVS
jgi:ribose transport system substrate-binding protein